jgi:hypothetical protein
MASDEQRDPRARGGWYLDPFDSAEERWWDGRKWTQKVRATPQGETTTAGASADETATDGVHRLRPGWYPCRGGVDRWWDGEKWGPAREVAIAPASTLEERNVGWGVRAAVGFEQVWLVRLGYVCAVLLPIIGILLGVVVLTRPALGSRRTQGIPIIILSLVITTLAVLLTRHR